MRKPVRGPMGKPVRGPMRKPVRGPMRKPVRGPMRKLVRGLNSTSRPSALLPGGLTKFLKDTCREAAPHLCKRNTAHLCKRNTARNFDRPYLLNPSSDKKVHKTKIEDL